MFVMSCRLSNSQCRLAVAACALMAGLYSQGQPAPAQTPATATNSHSNSQFRRYIPKNDPLKQLEEDLFQSFQSMPPSGPLDETMSGQPQPAASHPISKKAQMLEERRKNWAFMTPEELMGVTTPEEMANPAGDGKDGDQKKPLSLIEQYYQRQEHPEKLTSKSDQAEPFGIEKKRSAKEDSLLSGDKKWGDRPANGKRLNSFPGENDFDGQTHFDSDLQPGVLNQPSTISDVFGLRHAEPTPEELLVHKARMEEFQRILNANWHVSDTALPTAPGKDLVPPNGPGGLPFVLRPDDPYAASLGIASLMGGANDPLKNLNAPTLPGTGSTLPKTQPQSLTPPTPNFTAPRRQF